MRLGYAVGSKETIARMRKEALQINANAAVLAAARASFSDQDYIAECRTKVLASRNWLCEELAKDGRTFVPSQANFVMIEMRQDIRPIIDQFLARKILVGRQFPAMPTFLRVSIGTQDEMESFMAALREIAPAHSGKTA
jgi:histidinol-phosphate aminotransferase